MNDNGLNSAQLEYDKQEPVEDEPKLICNNCVCGIYEGETYYTVDEKIYCSQCMEEVFGRFA